MNRFFIYTVLVALAIASCVSAFAQIEIPSSPEAQRAVELSNIERAKQGLPPLKAQANLMRAAAQHAQDMAENRYFRHTGRNGSAPWDRALAAGYTGCLAENIFMCSGKGSPEQAVAAWMKSAGHRAAILNPGHVEIGIGFAQRRTAPKETYWVQVFGSRDNMLPVVINNDAWSTTNSRVTLFIYGEGRARTMALSNDGKTYGRFQPFRSRIDWTLAPGAGTQVVYVVTTDEQGRPTFANDSIVVNDGSADSALDSGDQAVAAEEPAASQTQSAPSNTNGSLPGLPGLAMGSPSVTQSEGDGVALRSQAPVRTTAHGPVVWMVFPVVGCKGWSDTWGAPRDGGKRQHKGQDLFAPKMTPLVAAFDGVVCFHRTNARGVHNILHLQGDNGWSAAYMHINNDTPGTDDGMGSWDFAFAPGLRSGEHVKAGDHIAWIGDSGNAENTPPHLHFELHSSSGVVNASASLRVAREISRTQFMASARNRAGSGRWIMASLPTSQQALRPAPISDIELASRGGFVRAANPAALRIREVAAPAYSQVSDCAVTPANVAQAQARTTEARLRAARRMLAKEQAEAEAAAQPKPAEIDVAKVIADAVNQNRGRYRLPKLILDERLSQVAANRAHAEADHDMNQRKRQRMPELALDAVSVGYRSTQIGAITDCAGEDADDVVTAWIDRNPAAVLRLLGKDYVHIGAARVAVQSEGDNAEPRWRWVIVVACEQDNG